RAVRAARWRSGPRRAGDVHRSGVRCSFAPQIAVADPYRAVRAAQLVADLLGDCDAAVLAARASDRERREVLVLGAVPAQHRGDHLEIALDELTRVRVAAHVAGHGGVRGA